MGDWTVITVLLVSVVVMNILIGLRLAKRTATHKWNLLSLNLGGRSGKSMDAYNFYHQYAGRLLFKSSLITVIPTAAIIILGFTMPDNQIIWTLGNIWTAILCFFSLWTTIPANIAIRKYFDKQGNRLF